MCGIVGLFVGCEQELSCPRRSILASASPTGGTVSDGVAQERADDYTSAFGSWFDKAGVRSTPRRVVSDKEVDLAFFKPELVPVMAHPLVRELPDPARRTLLVRHLYRYLDFTAQLENLVVNRTVLAIAHGTVGVAVPEEMRFDALKIHCDEAYHALFSVDLARQVESLTQVRRGEPERAYFLRRLCQIKDEVGPDRAPLVDLLFVIVSETLISATLTQGHAASPEVVTAVQDVIRDHALDEGRHHAFFASYLRFLWADLDPDERRFAALMVPRLIAVFLEPDTEAVGAELRALGLDDEQSAQVLAETFDPRTVADFTAATSRQTVAHFTRLDVLALPGVAEEFARHGL